jgi:DNA-binding CsgD family transcriptional regulator
MATVQRPDLTDREREVLLLVAKGMTNEEIAGKLWLSRHTVRGHINQLARKVGARNRTHMVALAFAPDGFVMPLGDVHGRLLLPASVHAALPELVGSMWQRIGQLQDLLIDRTAERDDARAEIAGRELVGWASFDGDEWHDFGYADASERRRWETGQRGPITVDGRVYHPLTVEAVDPVPGWLRGTWDAPGAPADETVATDG